MQITGKTDPAMFAIGIMIRVLARRIAALGGGEDWKAVIDDIRRDALRETDRTGVAGADQVEMLRVRAHARPIIDLVLSPPIVGRRR